MAITSLLIPVQAVVILFLPGAILLGAVPRRRFSTPPDWLEFGFFALVFSIAFSSIVGLLLAYLGLFTVPRLTALALLLSLVLLALHRRRSGLILQRSGKREFPALLLLLFLGVFLFSRPVPYIFGGWDPGVYVNTAVHLAREGTIFPADRLAGALEEEEIRELAWRHSTGYPEKYPGFRYFRSNPSRLIPEFYHLFPLWLAVLYSWAGLGGLFYLTPLAALAALAAVYLAVRELWGGRAALAAGLLLVFNVVQIWQARFPTSEMLSQFLFFAGVAAAFRYLKREEAFWAAAAGTAWGLFLLGRVSSLLIWFPLAVFFYCRWWKKFCRDDLYLLLPLLFFTGFSLAPQFFGDWRYFANSVANLRPGGMILQAGPVLAAVVVLLAAGLRLLPADLRDRLGRASSGSTARWLLLAAVAAVGVWAYFIRPYLDPPNADRTNLIELGWLLGPLLLAVAFVGILLFIRQERSPAGWLFFLVVAAPAVVFTWRQMVHFNYMWAARRFADAVIPGLIVFAVYALRCLSRARPGGRLLAPAALVLLLATSIRNSAPLFLHREYRGTRLFMDELAGRVSDSELVVVEGEFVDKLPTPLDLVYGRRVLPVYPGRPVPEGVWEKLAVRDERSAGIVYWLRDNPTPPAVGSGWSLEEKMRFHSPLWERRHDRLPRRADLRARDGNFTVYIFRGEEPPTAGVEDR